MGGGRRSTPNSHFLPHRGHVHSIILAKDEFGGSAAVGDSDPAKGE